MLPLLVALAADPCLDKATTDTDMRACVQADYEREDARLNTAYKALTAKIDAEARAILKKAQLAWIAFRDANCAWEEDKFRGGTLGRLEYVACLHAMTKARADDLEARLKLE